MTEREALKAIVSAAKKLLTCPHISLGDLVYTVRARELLGWDGPAVKQWSDGVMQLTKATEDAERLLS